MVVRRWRVEEGRKEGRTLVFFHHICRRTFAACVLKFWECTMRLSGLISHFFHPDLPLDVTPEGEIGVEKVDRGGRTRLVLQIIHPFPTLRDRFEVLVHRVCDCVDLFLDFGCLWVRFLIGIWVDLGGSLRFGAEEF
jgi:hypothetical protein